jgi:hypothetical protein
MDSCSGFWVGVQAGMAAFAALERMGPNFACFGSMSRIVIGVTLEHVCFVLLAVIWGGLRKRRSRRARAEAEQQRHDDAPTSISAEDLHPRLRALVRRLFASIDTRGKGYLDFEQTRRLLHALGETGVRRAGAEVAGAGSSSAGAEPVAAYQGLDGGRVCTFFGQLDVNRNAALSVQEIVHGLVWAKDDPYLKALIPDIGDLDGDDGGAASGGDDDGGGGGVGGGGGGGGGGGQGGGATGEVGLSFMQGYGTSVVHN